MRNSNTGVAMSPAVVRRFDRPTAKALSMLSTRNDFPGKGNSYEFQKRLRQRHDRRLLRRPGIRRAEAAAAHHGQMLRHRNEGRQRLRGWCRHHLCRHRECRLPGQCLEICGEGHLRDHQDTEGHRLARADQVLSCNEARAVPRAPHVSSVPCKAGTCPCLELPVCPRVPALASSLRISTTSSTLRNRSDSSRFTPRTTWARAGRRTRSWAHCANIMRCRCMASGFRLGRWGRSIGTISCGSKCYANATRRRVSPNISPGRRTAACTSTTFCRSLIHSRRWRGSPSISTRHRRRLDARCCSKIRLPTFVFPKARSRRSTSLPRYRSEPDAGCCSTSTTFSCRQKTTALSLCHIWSRFRWIG